MNLLPMIYQNISVLKDSAASCVLSSHFLKIFQLSAKEGLMEPEISAWSNLTLFLPNLNFQVKSGVLFGVTDCMHGSNSFK